MSSTGCVLLDGWEEQPRAAAFELEGNAARPAGVELLKKAAWATTSPVHWGVMAEHHTPTPSVPTRRRVMALAGLAGMIEVAAVHQRANASLIAGYGYAGILIAFLARQNPLAIVPMAVLVGGLGAAGGLLQRRLGLPDATVLLLQGLVFVSVLASETLFGRVRWFQPRTAGLAR